ncbi:hypothetical protein VF21_10168 [Pseudogymnoascus sp. 05NY08]|nr:hypothetical protein VF21_10168 [Pseudogymnoascus sp. 05NY08]
MDVGLVRSRIVATLDADADARRRAELDLKAAEEHAGFTDALLDILQGEQEASVRLSTAVYLKNRVSRAWAVSDDAATTHKPIPDEEKARFRERLLPVLSTSTAAVRAQLVPVLQKILHCDFPARWPGFMDVTLRLLNTNEAASIFAGLQCLLAICRVFRFKSGESRADFDKIVEATFPRLLVIGTGLVNETSEEAGEMLHLALKAYKHATFFDLAASLRQEQTTIGWCSLFIQTIGKEVPQSALSEDLTEREANHWWKAKKWAYFNLNRLFVRYGNPGSLVSGNGDDYVEFAKHFISTIAPEILKAYLAQIEKWVAKTTWLSRRCLSYTLAFLDECVKPKQMWAHLKPHLDTLVTHFLFPVLCLSEDDIEKFDTDPEDYLHHKLNFYEEVSAPDVAATNFLVTLTKVRRKQTYTILTFVNTIVNEYEATEDSKKNHVAKEGALRMIGTLSSVILAKKSPIATQVEYFLLLKLANEVDVDALSNVMEDFVEVFAAELTPFAVALSEQLRDTYLRIVNGLLEKNESRGDDDSYGDYLDDKSITALGVLQTIGTLILTLESTPEVLLHMESILMPVISITLENKLYDLYNEVFEIIDSCTFAAKSISPTMWQAFELIHQTFKAGAELYLEDMLPALDNFVQYGAAHLVQTPAYLDAMFGMVQDMFHDDKVGGVDRICACKLAEGMMLSLRGSIDQYVLAFVEMAMATLTNADVKVKSYKIHLMEMVINAIYYNPVLALHVLEAKGWTNKFFSLWFGSIDAFSRVHDKTLAIAAIVALLTLNPDQVPASVQQGWPRLLQGIVRLFQTLPAAAKNREEALKDDYPLADGAYSDDEEEEGVEWGGEDTAWAEEAEEEEDAEGKDESSAYLDFLNEEAQKFGNLDDESDDELGEESLLETPLDKVEPYGLFRDALMKLQTEQPQLYTSLTNSLSPEERTVVESAVAQADVIARKTAEEAAAAGTST